MALLLQQKGKHPTRVTFAASRKFCSTSSSSIANTELPKDMCVLDKRLDTWKNLNQHYSLINVIGSEGENHRQNYDLICEWIHKRFGRIFAYELVSNQEVRQFKDLKPVFSSVSIFPDVAMYTDKQEVPLLLFEVHSSPYHQTLKKMVLVLMEHLRWLRNCDLSIVKWSGFCFPKNTEATCVTRVDINWDYHNFQFIVDFFPLESNAVEYDVGRTIDRHLKMVQKDTFKVPSGHLIGIPLGEEDLGVFGDGAYQLHSNNCIIVVHEDKVYKYIVDLNDRDTMKDQLLNCRTDLGDEQSLYQLPIGGKNVGLKYFLIFPMLIFPMKVIEARQCLPEFIESVVKAIQSMHQQPLQRAHLDIRLENICFRQLGSAFTAVLIDLDRSKPIIFKAASLRYTEGAMYAVPGDWTVDKLDWHQLGCMIAHCIEGFDDYHNMTVPEYLKKDCFISKLIDQGEYSRSDLQNSVVHNYGKLSLTDVLEKRLEPQPGAQ